MKNTSSFQKNLLVVLLGVLFATTTHAQSQEQIGACLFLTWLDANPDTLRSLATTINDVDAWLAVGYQLFEENRYVETIEVCEECLKLKPLCFSAILLRGVCRIRVSSGGWEDLILVLSPGVS